MVGLPPGLQYSDQTGHITGTPTTAGIFRLTITAEGPAGIDKKTTTVVVEPSTPTTAPPPPPPPPGSWQSRDYGVGFTGSTSASGNTITIGAAGADIWENSDEFRFVYKAMTGDCTVEADISSLGATDAWAKAGVMIRAHETDARTQNVMAFLNPDGVFSLQYRATYGSATTSAGGWWLYNRWVRLVRGGNTFTAYSSPDGVNWTSRGSILVEMNPTVYVGFAVTSHNTTTATTAVFTDPFIK